jgi:nucleoid DNA-binding protein
LMLLKGGLMSQNTIVKPLTKAQLMGAVAEKSSLDVKSVSAVFDAFEAVIAEQLKGDAKSVTLTGLLKISVAHKAATPEKTQPHPSKKGETMVVKAKPARDVVKVKALKALKDMVS